jgi:gas vesicle protein
MKEVNSMSKDQQGTGKEFFFGALIGGLVGATTALFLAPKTGRDLRDNLNEQAIAVKGKTNEFRHTAIERGAEIAGLAKEKTISLSQVVSEQSSQLVDKVKNATDQMGEKTDQINEEPVDLIDKEKEGMAEELLNDAVKLSEEIEESVSEEQNYEPTNMESK